jgi:ABC-2 type transport system permease protein
MSAATEVRHGTDRAVRPGDFRLLRKQIGYEQRSFWRNRTRAFFAFLLPVMFLMIFATLNGNDPVDVGTETVPFVTFFVPGILAFGIVGATFTNLVMSITYLRETGVLKRIQGTPIPRWVYLAGLVGSSVITTLELTAVMLLIGRVLYGVHVRSDTLVGFLVILVLGTAAFAALGLAVSSVIPNADAAPAVTNALVLPLSFFSGVWFPLNDAPAWLSTLAGIFPLKHLAEGLQHAFLPGSQPPGLRLVNVAWLVGWFVVAAALAVWKFRWGAGRD